MPTETEHERRKVIADRLERLMLIGPSHGQSIGPAEVPLVIASLRHQPAPSADPGTAGRDAGAADGDDWASLQTAPKDGTSVVLAIPLLPPNGPAREYIVAEAYFNAEHEGGTWWWAGTSWGDYHAEPVQDVSHPLARWRPLPDPPRALPLHPEHQLKMTEGGERG